LAEFAAAQRRIANGATIKGSVGFYDYGVLLRIERGRDSQNARAQVIQARAQNVR
jgi:hypothetical protein